MTVPALWPWLSAVVDRRVRVVPQVPADGVQGLPFARIFAPPRVAKTADGELPAYESTRIESLRFCRAAGREQKNYSPCVTEHPTTTN